jgi:DNA polymerase-1
MHRARFGFAKGDYNIVYTFFRSFRALIEKMSPDKIIVALEGKPQFRYDLYPEYKANRKFLDAKKQEEFADFRRQKAFIIDILSKLPLELILHESYEGDDLIGTLVRKKYAQDDCIVVTGDSDFIQLLNDCSNVRIYNPIKKVWLKKPTVDYILWKSMVGDTSDNIKGIPRVGPKTADKVLSGTPSLIASWLDAKPVRRSTVTRNEKLIRFADVPLGEVQHLEVEPNICFVKQSFEKMGFESMLTDKAWSKFKTTFDI